MAFIAAMLFPVDRIRFGYFSQKFELLSYSLAHSVFEAGILLTTIILKHGRKSLYGIFVRDLQLLYFDRQVIFPSQPGLSIWWRTTQDKHSDWCRCWPRKMMAGCSSRARANRAFTSFSPSPTWLGDSEYSKVRDVHSVLYISEHWHVSYTCSFSQLHVISN